MSNRDPADEAGAGLVDVAKAPANEIGVGARAENTFDDIADGGEAGGVSGVLEGIKDSSAGLGGKVKFARGVRREVMGNYAVDLVAVGLIGGW